jgi:hypothetical protein
MSNIIINEDIVCSICDTTFKETRSIKVHLKNHLKDSPNSKNIIDNETQRINKLKPHTCKNCNKSFKCFKRASEHKCKQTNIVQNVQKNAVENTQENIQSDNNIKNIQQNIIQHNVQNNTNITNNITYHIHLYNITDMINVDIIKQVKISDFIKRIKPFATKIDKDNTNITDLLIDYDNAEKYKNYEYDVFRRKNLLEGCILNNYDMIKYHLMDLIDSTFELIFFNPDHKQYHIIYVIRKEIHKNYYFRKNNKWNETGDISLFEYIVSKIYNLIDDYIKNVPMNLIDICDYQLCGYIINRCYNENSRIIGQTVAKRLHKISYSNRHMISPIFEQTINIKDSDYKEEINNNKIMENNKSNDNYKETNKRTDKETDEETDKETDKPEDIDDENMNADYVTYYGIEYIQIGNILYEVPPPILPGEMEYGFDDLVKAGEISDNGDYIIFV